MQEKISYKLLLKQHCEQIILERIAVTQRAMNDAQAAANEESKSSVGDKYETARAMSQLEKDMHARQLAAHQQDLQAIRAINVQTIYFLPVAGAFVKASTVSFFIGAGLGKQTVNEEDIIFLSPVSPLAKQLMQKKTGDEFEFKGKNNILEIY
ncbi:GreA/GreB family elongation factor [Gynurincola endophyticus]|uniref:GreA/GreB family elongation factor n=1 Tax=Gynurincola endophyticus TaxID=2479004 RepID=UPI000F8D007D|nr:GreA/GreB family elongation factor [Gynurincola endophyticus]